MPQTPWTILLNSGSLRSLAASGMQIDTDRLIVLFVHDGRPASDHFYSASQRQAGYCKASKHMDLRLEHLVTPRDTPKNDVHALRTPLADAQILLAAASLACQIKAERIVWPVNMGDDFDGIAKVAETVQLIQALCGTETATPIRIETPLLEMSGREVIEIGHQMQVPWELARSCSVSQPEACGRCQACLERLEMFNAAGVDDAPAVARASR